MQVEVDVASGARSRGKGSVWRRGGVDDVVGVGEVEKGEREV